MFDHIWSGVDSVVHKHWWTIVKHYRPEIPREILEKYHKYQSEVADRVEGMILHIPPRPASPMLKSFGRDNSHPETNVELHVLQLPMSAISKVYDIQTRKEYYVSILPYISWNTTDHFLFDDVFKQIPDEVKTLLGKGCLCKNSKFEPNKKGWVVTITDLWASIETFVNQYEQVMWL